MKVNYSMFFATTIYQIPTTMLCELQLTVLLYFNVLGHGVVIAQSFSVTIGQAYMSVCPSTRYSIHAWFRPDTGRPLGIGDFASYTLAMHISLLLVSAYSSSIRPGSSF